MRVVACPKCAKRFKVMVNTHEGRVKARCPHCGETAKFGDDPMKDGEVAKAIRMMLMGDGK